MKFVRLALSLAILAIATHASALTIYCCSASACCQGVSSVDECNAMDGIPFFQVTSCLQNCSYCSL